MESVLLLARRRGGAGDRRAALVPEPPHLLELVQPVVDRLHGPLSGKARHQAAPQLGPVQPHLRAPQARSGGGGGRKVSRSRGRSEEHTSELQSLAYLVCRLLLEKKKKQKNTQ